jgi:effector-binding domain-containing protein
VAYEVVLEEVASRPIAAVHTYVPVGQVAAAWRPALDKVWAFLRRHGGLRADGHNIFVYRHPVRPGAPMEVEFGVEVSGLFPGDDEIVFTQTPAGHVASTIHLGPPDELAAANAAIEDWCVANQRQLAGVSWEIYGDPGEDPAILEVRVFYLLGGASRERSSPRHRLP